jgi:predicted metalloendopeptidase
LDRIESISSRADLVEVLIGFQETTTADPDGFSVAGPFLFTDGVDAKNSKAVIVQIADRSDPSGPNSGVLSLPDRDYYLKTDAKSSEIRKAFVSHVTRMLELLGDSRESAMSAATTVLAFETWIMHTISVSSAGPLGWSGRC